MLGELEGLTIGHLHMLWAQQLVRSLFALLFIDVLGGRVFQPRIRKPTRKLYGHRTN